MFTIIEIPHQNEPVIYTIEEMNDLVDIAFDSGFVYRVENRKTIEETYGEDRKAWPNEIVEISNGDNFEIVEVYNGDHSLYFSKKNAPDKLESAIEFLKNDLRDFIIYNDEDVVNFISGKKEERFPFEKINSIKRELEGKTGLTHNEEKVIKFKLKYAIEKESTRQQLSKAMNLSITSVNDSLGSRFDRTSIKKLIKMANSIGLSISIDID